MKKQTINLFWNFVGWRAELPNGDTLCPLCVRQTQIALNLERGVNYKLRIRQTKTNKTATISLYREHNGVWYWIVKQHPRLAGHGMNLFAGLSVDRFITDTFSSNLDANGFAHLNIKVENIP